MMMAAMAAMMTTTADASGFTAGGAALAGAFTEGGGAMVLIEFTPMSANVWQAFPQVLSFSGTLAWQRREQIYEEQE
jgi:S-formylglutathione hydrolase FrmB